MEKPAGNYIYADRNNDLERAIVQKQECGKRESGIYSSGTS